MLFKAFIVLRWWIHLVKACPSLYRANKHDLAVKHRVNLDKQKHFFKVASLILSKALSLDLNHRGFGSLEIPLNKLVMHYSDRSWHYGANVLSNEIFSGVTKNMLKLLIDINYQTNLVSCGSDNDDTRGSVLSEYQILCPSLLTPVQFTLVDSKRFLKKIYSVLLIVHDVQQEEAMATDQLNILRIYRLGFFENLLKFKIVL